MFQSTHPHGVRRKNSYSQTNPTSVSIHAPARGATLDEDKEFRIVEVSIHAPARGATWQTGQGCAAPNKFQSTHPHGVRRPEPCSYADYKESFNPRTRTGCDTWTKLDELVTHLVSIHAPARGATLGWKNLFPSASVSIHAPARGATSGPAPAVGYCLGFNPRTRTGCDARKHLSSH